jgi:hypothetical protein
LPPVRAAVAERTAIRRVLHRPPEWS